MDSTNYQPDWLIQQWLLYRPIIAHAMNSNPDTQLGSQNKNFGAQTCRQTEGGVRVCGIAVLGYFWCGFAVIFFSKHGNAVFKVQAVRGNFKFYVAVIGEKIVVSR